MRQVDHDIADIRSEMRGRTYSEGAPRTRDELLVEEIDRLSAELGLTKILLGEQCANYSDLQDLMHEAVEDLTTRAKLAVDSGDEKEVVLCVSNGILSRMREAIGSEEAQP